MPIPELGMLQEIDLREAWDHEAHSFTPWLAQNLDVLAQVIGMPLEFEGQEVAVENFSADILARNPQDESYVLIENQLEMADHNHLGQIMTYLAGLEANTVIWIARDFRDAHLSAVRWLNDHTVGLFAFFAVKVRVVRIGESPLAPIFDVLVRPNRWERTLHAAAEEVKIRSDLGQSRKAFWENYLRLFPNEERHGAATRQGYRWRTLENLNLVITSYISRDGVGVFIRGPRGADSQEVYETLLPFARQIGDQLDAELGSPDSPYFFAILFSGDINDQGQWDQLANWLYDAANEYENALQMIMGERR